MKTLHVRKDLALYHVGPPLENGPLPSLFYFALSGPDSLTKDPFNQPVQHLSKNYRCFSLTIPAHENERSPHTALASWGKDFAEGNNILEPFFNDALEAVQFVIDQKLTDPKKLAIAGLSRGGFLSSHIAARETGFGAILQFAPLTLLSKHKDFTPSPLVDSLDVHYLVPKLSDRKVRFYIGNKDTLVDTRACFEFAMQLSENCPHRSPQITFILSPSIGLHGHGTAPETFRSGAEWLIDFFEGK